MTGFDIVHLLAPDEAALRAAFVEPVDHVAIVVRGDLPALRFVLLAEHLQPDVPVVVTIFDRTMAAQLAEVVPHCTVISPADVAAPAIVAACVQPGALALLATSITADAVGSVGRTGPHAVLDREGHAVVVPWQQQGQALGSRLSRWLPRRSGGTEGLLLVGLLGLLAIIALEWALGALVLHDGPLEALYAATRLVSTVGPADATAHGAPGWYLVVSALLMLIGIGFTGALVAGLVEWIVSARTASFVGPRSIPRRRHVVVSGLGQVGLRVAQLLRELDVPVVVVERLSTARNLPLARASRLPVVIGDAGERAVLHRVGLGRARALAALGSDDLDNVAVVISALSVAPGVETVIRAGEDPAVEETTSLFRIGQVADVSAMTAAWVCASVRGERPLVAYTADGLVGALSGTGDHRCPAPPRCRCA